MPQRKPVCIESGALDWQVFARRGNYASPSLRIHQRTQEAPGTVYTRLVSEKNGRVLQPWKAAQPLGGGYWEAVIRVPVGGPYRLETCARTDDLKFDDAVSGDFRQHLFAGDLFLIAGQSNAAGYARDSIPDPPCMGVSVLRLNGKWDLAAHPINDGTDSIRPVMEVCMPAHSPWLIFAKSLYRETRVPVGLLPAAIGGSPMSSWVPGGVLYQSALDTVRDAGAIRGVLWYQGCADALDYNTENYGQRFLSMVEAFRKDIGQADLPFFTCQLNGFAAPGIPKDDIAWAGIREQQKQCSRHKGVYLLPTAGLRLYDQIHNSARSNLTIGRQIASQALHVLYGRELRWRPPEVIRVTRAPEQLILQLSPVNGGLQVEPNVRRAFTARVGERELPIRLVRTQKDELILEGKALHRADRLSYAQTRDLTDAGVFDRVGLWALAPFDLDLRDIEDETAETAAGKNI